MKEEEMKAARAAMKEVVNSIPKEAKEEFARQFVEELMWGKRRRY